MKSISKKTTSTASSIERPFHMVRTRITDELFPKCPANKYLNLEQRMALIPRGFSCKIDDIWWLFQRPDDANILHFKKHTLHPAYFKVTKNTHKFLINNIEKVWNFTAKICKENKFELGNFRKSFLELVDVDGDKELSSNEDLLYIIASAIIDDKNPLSKIFVDILYRYEIAYKTWEYRSQS